MMRKKQMLLMLRQAVFLSSAFILVSGAARAQASAEISDGSTVTIHYVLTVDGKIRDSSKGKKPMSYVQGTGQIIPGLEQEIRNLKVGDEKRIIVAPGDGYGPVNPDMFQNVPKKSVKGRSKLKIGSTVSGQFGGRQVNAVIIGEDKDNFILDLNHPLAGKTLQFDVEIVEISRKRAVKNEE